MISMGKILLLLVGVGAFWNVGTSARGLQPAQPSQPVEPVQSVQPGNPNHGFTLQSGYEGYLLSPQKASNAVSAWSELWGALVKIGLPKSSKSLLVPLSTFILLYGFKIFKGLIQIVGLLAIGTLLTIPLCAFTSFCNSSLANSPFSFLKANAVKEQMTEFARTYMSPEKLEMATRFVQSALETYSMASHKLKGQLSDPDQLQLPSERPDDQQNEAHPD